MKKLVLRFSLFSIILLMIFSIIVILLKINNYKPLLTNSVSFDAKAEHIRDNLKNVDGLDLMIIGSSMSLNNISSDTLSSKFKDSLLFYNFSSWGLQICDLNSMLAFLIDRYKPKLILLAVSPFDFSNIYINKPIISISNFEKYLNGYPDFFFIS